MTDKLMLVAHKSQMKRAQIFISKMAMCLKPNKFRLYMHFNLYCKYTDTENLNN